VPFNVPRLKQERLAESVIVLWSPGVGRDLAHRLVQRAGLPILGLRMGDAHVSNHCAVCGSSEHGRPVLTPLQGRAILHLSISYADDLTVVALTGAGPVGVDVERNAAASFPGFDAVVRHEQEVGADERSETVTWVRKESLLKATGRGLIVDPRQIRLTASDQPPGLVTWAATDPPNGPVWLFDVEITNEHVSAVTVLAAADRPHLVVRRADLGVLPG
jgi:4'-phosphopantetheinyl transferase